MNSARPPDSADASTAAAATAADATTTTVAELLIEHQPGRFWMRVDGHLCVADYRPARLQATSIGQVIDIVHTEVPPALQGRGLAAVLMQALLAWARTEGLQVRPVCSYARSYMRRHAETQDLLAS